MLTQDESICIMGMRVRQYVADKSKREEWSDHPIRIILSLNRSYNAVYFNSGFYGALPSVMTSNIDCKDATTSVSIREIQLQVLAKGIVCPGFAPFIANIASFCGDVFEEMDSKEAKEKFDKMKDPWLKEYFKGAANELYTLSLPFRLNSVAIPKLAAMLYHEKNCVMLQYSREVQLDGTMHLKVLAPTYKKSMECDKYLKTLLASSVPSHEVWETLSNNSSNRISTVKSRLKRMSTIEAYYGEDDEAEKLLSYAEGAWSSPDYKEGSNPDDGHPEPTLKMVFSSAAPGGAPDASFEQHTKRHHATPLSLEECSNCLLQYQETSFEENYGPLREFSERHVMHPMEEREEEITRNKDEDDEAFKVRLNNDNNKDDGMEALVQKPHNDVMMLRTAHNVDKHLDQHIIIVVQHLRHVAHFVRVLRTIDIPKKDYKEIVIVTNDASDFMTRKLLRMFQGVYIIEVPKEDNNYVSVKTMKGIGLDKASQVVLTASACSAIYDDDGEVISTAAENTAKMDDHKMCLRMVIRKLNPECVTTLEVDDFSQARFFVRGSATVNAFSSDSEMKKVQTAIMSQEWVHRDDAVNRAACIASGIFVEEDLLQPLVISCVHKSHDIEFAQAMLGGSKHNFSTICIDVPEKMIGETYMHFFAILCWHGKTPLALYRTSKYDLQEYIYNNPAKNTVLQSGDKIYISSAFSLSNSERLEEVVRVRQIQLEADLNFTHEAQVQGKVPPGSTAAFLESRNKALKKHNEESFREARSLTTQRISLVEKQDQAAKLRADGHEADELDKLDAEADELQAALLTHEQEVAKRHRDMKYNTPVSTK